MMPGIMGGFVPWHMRGTAPRALGNTRQRYKRRRRRRQQQLLLLLLLWFLFILLLLSHDPPRCSFFIPFFR
jgi:4-amino-4-deoxy-L-arabinose transferase-like glycosyltransferase